MSKSKKLHLFFKPEMAYQLQNDELYHHFFYKPRLLISRIVKNNLASHFTVHKNWEPFSLHDFYVAHEKSYVDAFFQGKGLDCSSSGVPWSAQFTKAVRYMNASLHAAILHSIQRPEKITVCPAGGFMYARPSGGAIFSTFSGQVIAAIKIMTSMQKKGAFIDLGALPSTAIPESRKFFFDNQVDRAIPQEAYLCPEGEHERYLNNLRKGMDRIVQLACDGEIDYIVYSHGTDSHEEEDIGNKCTMEEWLECSSIVYDAVRLLREEKNIEIPFAIVLEGGFRNERFSRVISLHLADMIECLNRFYNAGIEYNLNSANG